MKNKSLFDSFSNALAGIIETFRNERNFKIHFFAAFMVFLLILFVDVDAKEFLIVLSSIFLVLVTELINTSVEAVVDLYCGEKRDPRAKLAKDAAAGGVFLATMYSVIVGYVLIFRKLIEFDYHSYLLHRIQSTPIHLTVVAVLLTLMVTVAIKTFSGQKNPLRGGLPSSHAAVAFAVATAILFLVENMIAVMLAYFLAALVAQSRIEGRIHSMIQVLLGSLLGIFITVLIFQIR
ncbi:diacylglycerol kinase [Clostridia bacterium]|nr:diacylglycerol kinase [Clostridia bacterium]GHU77231.1 diacylglycerol kinase [Clostridia bacterium]